MTVLLEYILMTALLEQLVLQSPVHTGSLTPVLPLLGM